jgi:hypothetical protein
VKSSGTIVQPMGAGTHFFSRTISGAVIAGSARRTSSFADRAQRLGEMDVEVAGELRGADLGVHVRRSRCSHAGYPRVHVPAIPAFTCARDPH